jgi:hypothetical protein
MATDYVWQGELNNGDKEMSYTIGPFSADTVTTYCMLTMIHSAIHVDTAAAQAVGGLTVPTPLGTPPRLPTSRDSW